MERFLGGDLTGLPDYNKKSLLDAIWYFKNATAVQSDCGLAHLHLGIALLQDEQNEASASALEKVRTHTSISRAFDGYESRRDHQI